MPWHGYEPSSKSCNSVRCLNERGEATSSALHWSFFDTTLSPRMHLTAPLQKLLGGEHSDSEKGCRCQRCHTSLHGGSQGTGTFWVPRSPPRRDPITVFSDTLPQKLLRWAPETDSPGIERACWLVLPCLPLRRQEKWAVVTLACYMLTGASPIARICICQSGALSNVKMRLCRD